MALRLAIGWSRRMVASDSTIAARASSAAPNHIHESDRRNHLQSSGFSGA